MEIVDLASQPGPLIRRLQTVHAAIFAAVLGTEVTSPQLAMLCVIAEEPGIDQGLALTRAHVDRSTGTDIVARLRRRRLIDQRVDPRDSRRRLLSLTPAGEALVEDLMPRALDVGADLMDGLDESEQAALMSLMRRILDRWEGEEIVKVTARHLDASKRSTAGSRRAMASEVIS